MFSAVTRIWEKISVAVLTLGNKVTNLTLESDFVCLFSLQKVDFVFGKFFRWSSKLEVLEAWRAVPTLIWKKGLLSWTKYCIVP